MERQTQDSQFYFQTEVDENQVCRSIFWADDSARNVYKCFSDMVVFDVTCKTNYFFHNILHYFRTRAKDTEFRSRIKDYVKEYWVVFCYRALSSALEDWVLGSVAEHWVL